MWAHTVNAVSLAAAAPFVPHQQDLLSGFQARYGADLVGITVVRLRGYVVANSTLANTPLVVAARVGTEGEVPSTEFNPMTAGEYNDWMMYEPMLAPIAAREPIQDVSARVIDVKSMRKVDELDQTLFLYAGTNQAAAATITLFYNVSALLMLP